MFEVVLMIGFLWAGLCRLGLDAGAEQGRTASPDQAESIEPSPSPASSARACTLPVPLR